MGRKKSRCNNRTLNEAAFFVRGREFSSWSEQAVTRLVEKLKLSAGIILVEGVPTLRVNAPIDDRRKGVRKQIQAALEDLGVTNVTIDDMWIVEMPVTPEPEGI